MNNICLTRCLVNSAQFKGNYIVLNCSTKLFTERNSPVNCTVFAYITEEIMKNKRLQQIGLKPGAYFKMTGKTVIDSDASGVKINMMIDAARFIEYPEKESVGRIKLLDIQSPNKQVGFKFCKNYYEILASYLNTPNGPQRKIIVKADIAYQNEIALNTSYNISGDFFLRKMGNQYYPVVWAKTFVRDIRIDERIPVIIR